MSEGFADEEDPSADVLDADRFFEIEIVPFDRYRFIIDGYDAMIDGSVYQRRVVSYDISHLDD